MVRNLLFLLLVMSNLLFAQEENPSAYKNVLKGTATLAPGFMLSQTQGNIYVHGHLEYFPEERVSLRGEGFWFTGAQEKQPLLKENSTLLFGVLYHFHKNTGQLKNNLDFFMGIQPGAAFTRPANTKDSTTVGSGPSTITTSTTSEYGLKVLPVFSPFTGITFYPGKYVNFFLELRYVSGKYFGYRGGTLDMREVRLSAGLGFQLPLRKKA